MVSAIAQLFPSTEMLVSVELPAPISINGLFVQRTGQRRRIRSRPYEQWRREAGQMIAAQGGRKLRVSGPVGIVLLVGAKGVSAQMDTDNVGKAYLDILVSLGVLPDDRRTIVRALLIAWQDDARGCVVQFWRWEAGK